MDYNKYFAQANEEANETYLNYGYPAVDADFDDYVEAGGSYMNQTGGGQMGGAPTSQPYILTLSNSTTNNITSNIIGGQPANNNSNVGNGNGIRMVCSTSCKTRTTYVEFLYQKNKPFIVGLPT